MEYHHLEGKDFFKIGHKSKNHKEKLTDGTLKSVTPIHQKIPIRG